MAIYRQAPPAMLVRHLPTGRRQRQARTRTVALAAIIAVAASGAVLQEMQYRASVRGVDMASAPTPPGPFDYFPG